MSKAHETFIDSAEKIVFDRDHRSVINHNISKYEASFKSGLQQFSKLDLARQRASHLKTKVIDKLDNYLIEFESNFIKRGGKVVWAQNHQEASAEILKIVQKVQARSVVKGKSMVSEEIDINSQLLSNKIDVFETDLGEYIQQLAGEPPYHIVTPAMHRSKENVAALFAEKKGTKADSTPTEITQFVRNEMRERFEAADVGITGANFLIADAGAIAITENEGNVSLSASLPKTHIVVTGIEKLIPSLTDLSLFFPLLATHGTGQQISVYNSIITGPRQHGEKDGPEELYLVLVDNGRSSLLAEPEQRRALNCIKCGACLNVCPVYKNVGGHTYNTPYQGPIGNIVSPYLTNYQEHKHLAFASSVCGACTAICPVNIDLHKLFLYERNKLVVSGETTKKENWTMYFWKNAMLKRSKMEKGGPTLKNFMLKQFFKKAWGERREMPEIAPKSFNQMWKERKGIK